MESCETFVFFSSGFRLRRRHVLMESTGPAGHCPHLVESVPCEDPMCYRWLASEGICIPDHGKCGLGHRILKAVCQNDRGMRQRNMLLSDICPMTSQFSNRSFSQARETPLSCLWILTFKSDATWLQGKPPWLTLRPHTLKESYVITPECNTVNLQLSLQFSIYQDRAYRIPLGSLQLINAKQVLFAFFKVDM